ncbi:NAD(P)-binding domain-containing protein [uncultured Sulfitobacter sp.]|uniref:NAD(P)-binding domain-containing protein n=1 Tax=uncultured Sulfitobacter sp. TaxID=191468 RepID=UPI00261C7AD9|nr:NAD(P)-binding domain-containing protein [uncultured Sulfitobacter sp.]
MRVGFVGTGVIAAAMVEALSGRGHDLLVSSRNAATAADLAQRFDDVRVLDNPDVVSGADVVFLCLMADVARDVLTALPWRGDQSVISVMADLPLVQLTALCAPASDIALTIPLSSITAGRSVLPCHPDSDALRALFGESDTIIPVATEAGLNAHFVASALSAPILAMMQTGAGWLAEQTGDSKAAEAYVAGVFAGFMRQMSVQGADFETLLEGLATEGGLNATLLAQIAEIGAPDALVQGMVGLQARLGI